MNDFDNRLGESLKSLSATLRANRVERAVAARADFHRRLRRRRITRFASLAAAAGVLGGAIAVAATMGTTLFERTDRAPSLPEPAAGIYIRVGDDPVGVSVGDDAVWVASSEGTVTRVDPAKNRSTGVIGTGGQPSDVALSDGRAWYSDAEAGTVRPLDTVTGKYADEPTFIGSQGRHIDVDVGPQGTVWATSYDSGMLIGIDPATGEIRNRVPVDRPVELAIAPGSLWALVENGGALIKYDFETAAEVLRVPLDDTEKTDLAAIASGVYIAEEDGTVLRVSPSTGEITARGAVAGTRPEIAAGDGALWVASDVTGADGELARLALRNLTLVGEVRTFLGAPTDIAAGDGSVWISDTGRETVVRIKISAAR